MTKTKANKMQIEDMTEQQVRIKLDKIIKEIYNLQFNGRDIMSVVVDVNTLDFYSMSWQEALRDNINSDELAVFQCFQCYRYDWVKEDVEQWHAWA